MTNRTPVVPDTDRLPPVSPAVTTAAVAALPSRLRRRLDEAVERLAGVPVGRVDGGLSLDCGPEARVTLSAGATGVVTDPEQARCSCLLAPRCLHRAAVLVACPVADPADHPGPPFADPSTSDSLGPAAGRSDRAGRTGPAGSAARVGTGERTARAGTAGPAAAGTGPGGGPTKAQRAAADALWRAAAVVLVSGVPAAGAVPRTDLLRAAHGARLAGLPRAESAALRVVRGLRAHRDRQAGRRLADLVEVLHDLLYVAGRLAAGDPDPALVGVLRRAYQPDGTLEVYGVCREPVISATGYAGVVTHLVAADGRRLSFGDVRPGGPARARDCARAVTEMGAVAVDHAALARGGLRVTGTTISPDGRLGAGARVRATPLAGTDWSTGPLAELFARPLADVVAAQLTVDDPEDPGRAGTALLGADLLVLGAAGDRVLARELAPGVGADRLPVPDGPLLRLVPADPHPALAHVTNLRRLASRPGLRIRVVGRLDPDRAGTLRPLAVGAVPGAAVTLRLPAQWHGRADLGYDQIQGGHLPAREEAGTPGPVAADDTDLLAESPLWRVRRLVELAVSGGRRAVAEATRDETAALTGPLRGAGFTTAAGLASALVAEADRRGRDAFGRLADPDPDRYAWAWLAAAAHLAATERELIRSSWTATSVG
ncbi:SWIM zinc finger family protein [Micromonospora cathayae]|uniref:SWIM zinc finger family protein n=1 Tax=Micromonospora cathayae TaxID=3028804 RepID=A0ABY7ZL73_9ACTN|nr:SWIM zinc finger family protein [Micromonospora sp. HUAS 3]WDZ83695.1 SWIM zinc finger family protein [Micromonospora sp. HUAS 3]